MNDLDFDELDKAVSSLMGKAQAKKDGPTSGGTETKNDNVAIPDNATESAENDETHTNETVVAKPMAAPDDANISQIIKSHEQPKQDEKHRLERQDIKSTSDNRPNESRRAGRFMDVKHDSSDMRTPAPAASREGNTIEPLADDYESDFDYNLSKLSDTPDDPQTSADDSKSHSQPLETPTSPFLTNAKVEKRPLGRSDKSSQKDELETEAQKPEADQYLKENSTNSELDQSPSDEPAELPEELRPDLVSIEAGTDTEASPGPVEQESEPSKPVSRRSKVDLSSELETDDGADEPSKPTGPVSIAQQYKESPSSQPEKNGTIYDTENYHQPISHPAKKKSGWMAVVWILLIIVLGCSLGVAVYFSGLA